MTDFGTDTSCTTGLASGVYSTGPRLVAEAAYRRLTTPRGTLRGGEEEKNYGLDLLDLIGSVSTPSDVASLEGRIASELAKDERINSITVTVVRTISGPAVTYQIAISAVTAEGPFSLTLGVSAVTVDILGLTPDATS